MSKLQSVLFGSISFHVNVLMSKISYDRDEQDAGSTVSAAAATGSNHSCDVTSELSYSDIIQRVEEDEERWGDVCVGHGKQDHIIVFTTTMWTQVWTWYHLYRPQHEELTHLWSIQLPAKAHNPHPRLQVPPGCNHFKLSDFTWHYSFICENFSHLNDISLHIHFFRYGNVCLLYFPTFYSYLY